MDASYARGSRGRGGGVARDASPRGRPHSRNKHWSASDAQKSHIPDGERWERGGHRGGGRGRGGRGVTRIFPNVSLRINNAPKPTPVHVEDDIMTDTEEQEEEPVATINEPELSTPEAREKFYQELVKAREVERKQAIADGKMDDPNVPKRLEDAITIVGTCTDMCPRFERYRRERENNLFEWELIPGTKRVDHNRAVKMYERAAGDKTLPSDLRPPKVLRRTLDYLFRDLLPRGGFQGTFSFIRDRSRSVRNDFTMQHITGPLAIECHDRCARFHILAMHLQKDVHGFQYEMEDQQLMNTLQSLKEFYDANRESYQAPTELEMRVYHRLIHIRDQVERPEQVPVPTHITEHPVFKLVTQFRLHVQAKSAPITKKSTLVVGPEGMQIFGELARQLHEQGSAVMVYLVACILERLFGKDTIDEIESIKGDLTLSEIIDGISSHGHMGEEHAEDVVQDETQNETHGADEEGVYEEDGDGQEYDEEDEHHYEEEPATAPAAPAPIQPTVSWPTTSVFSTQPTGSSSVPPVAKSAFGNIKTTTTSVFGGAVFGAPVASSSQPAPQSVFGNIIARDNTSSTSSPFGKPASLAAAPPLGTSTGAPAAQNGSTTTTPSPFSQARSLATAPPLSSSVSEPAPVPTDGNTTVAASIFGNKSSSLATAPPLSTPVNAPSVSTPSPPKAPTPSFSSNAQAPQPNFFNKPPTPLAPFASSNQSTAPFSGNLFSTTPSTNVAQSSSTGLVFSSAPANGSSSSRLSLNAQAPAFEPSNTSRPANPFAQAPSIVSSSFSLPPFSTTTAPLAPSAPTASSNAAAPAEVLQNGNASAIAASSNAERKSSDSTPPPSLMRKSSSGSKSTTPPTTRLVAPPMLKINTNTSNGSTSTSSSFVSGAGAPVGAVNSPREPPPLARQIPVALPETPTLPPNPLLGHLRNTLTRSPSGSMNQSQEILSPLIMGSPTTGSLQNLKNFSPLSTPSIPRRFSIRCPSPTEGSKYIIPSGSLSNGKGKGKAPERRQYTIAEEQRLEETAVRFEQRSVVVKESFKHWVNMTTDKLMYLEARRHEDEYRERLRQSGSSSLRKSVNGRASVRDGAMVVLDKKRRISRNGEGNGVESSGVSPLKKRARKSEYIAPRTDEELAKRLKENQEEHEKRWATGSFLQVIRSHVKTLDASVLKLPWNVWVSMNPDSDATAIWMEKKFNIPTSGTWVNENVFSIPLASALVPPDSGYPGLIVFECTPAGDLTDELERKYRILDDCARLREVIKALSPRRYFVPSLLVICWCEPEELSKDSDFFDMVKKLVTNSTLESYHVLPITATTNDLDTKLAASLTSMTIDSTGKLIQTLSLRELFKIFEPIYTAFVSEWVENANINGNFHWNLFAQLIQAAVDLLSTISHSVWTLLELPGPHDVYPLFDPAHVDDSESCYDEVNDWLSSLNFRDEARLVVTDLHSHRNIGQQFPTRIFVNHLLELTELRFERLFPKTTTAYYPILNTSINSATQSLKDAVQPHQLKLSQTYNLSVRRSPKRRPHSATTSEIGSPSVKRARLSTSVTSFDEDDDRGTEIMSPPVHRESTSPTPSLMSTTTTETPSVTVAMLRALTRDIKKRYGSA